MMKTDAEIRARHSWDGCSHDADGRRTEHCTCGRDYKVGRGCPLQIQELQQLEHDHHRMDDDGAPARDAELLRNFGLA